jgi:hypothetical protein
VSSFRRRAQPRSTARIGRSRFPSMVSMVSEQVTRLFPGEPVSWPAAGSADILEGHDSLGHDAIEQSVFGPLLRPVCGSPTARTSKTGHPVNARHEAHTGRIVHCGIGVDRRPPHGCRIVLRYVDHLRRGGFNGDVILTVVRGGSDCLLGCACAHLPPL